jgi:hypothetical protein
MNTKPKRQRVRYSIPNYKKVYSVYQYDVPEYKKIFKKIHNLAMKYDADIFNRTSAYMVLERCYLRDEQGNKNHLGDARHIFRYKVLQAICKEIADYILIAYEIIPETLEYLYNRTHLYLAYTPEYSQAELIETCNLPIKERLQIHIALLRRLHNGAEIEQAINETRELFNIPFKDTCLQYIYDADNC